MSAEASSWAWRQKANSGAKMVLLCLADQADPLGRCRASAQEIADKCGFTRSTVFKHLTELEGVQLLERTHERKASRQAPNGYVLGMNQAPHSQLRDSENPSVQNPDTEIETASVQDPDAQTEPESELEILADVPDGATQINEPSLSKYIDDINNNGVQGLLGGEGEDRSMWPESYSLLYGIEGFRVLIGDYIKWLELQKISEAFASQTVYAMRDWLLNTPKGRKRAAQKDFNPYFTFQNWCVKDRVKDSPKDERDGGWGNAKSK